jgi:amino acid adenylation domain-containing protein
MGILRHELSVLYDAFLAGAASPLVELEIQYADYAEWQRDWLQGEVLEAQLEYWRKQLEGAPPTLSLPTDRPRPPVQSSQGAKESVLLSLDLTEALKGLSKGEGGTLFMTLLAAFKVLLYRYTGQGDLVVGTAVANRNRGEIEPLIGFFVNTLALRSNLSANPTFRQLLGQVREVCLGAYAHQDLPFEKLVEDLNPERDLSRNPLVQVMFILQNVPPQPLALTGLAVDQLEIEEASARFDLNWHVTESAEGLLVSVVYSTDLFDRGTVARMLGHLQRLLEGVVADPDQKLSDLPLLTPEERHQLLVAWNDTQAHYPQDRCIHQLFEAQVERTPQAIAVVQQSERLTYAQLNRRANLLAHRLQALGVRPGVLVGICAERSLEMIVGLLGILKAGGGYVPLDPDYPPGRLALMLRDARATVLLTRRSLWPLPGLSPEQFDSIYLEDMLEAPLDSDLGNPETNIQPEDLAYAIYTSGSTGQPKGTLVPHRGVVSYLTQIIAKHALGGHTVVLQLPSFAFDASVRDLFAPLAAGGRLILPTQDEARSPAELLMIMREQGVNCLLSLVPSLLRAMFQEHRTGGHRADNVELILVSGESLLWSDWQNAQALFGKEAQVVNQYGPTEGPLTATRYVLTSQPPGQEAVPIGRPIPNVQVHILDTHLNPVPVGAPGEICLGGVGLAHGYLNRPGLTASVFVPHPFSTEPGARLYRTGDLGRYRPDGNIEFLGRSDHQVKIRGYRVELGEIEAVLVQHEAVPEAVVVLRSDERGGQHLVAYLVAKGDPAPTAADLRAFLRQKLPQYMVPGAYVVLDALPLTPNRKVDRRALPAPDWSLTDERFIAPRTPVEEIVAGIWAEVLGLERVGISDSFFDLGGHSLLATQIISRLRARFRIEIPLRALFESPTVAGLAEAISYAATEPEE